VTEAGSCRAPADLAPRETLAAGDERAGAVAAIHDEESSTRVARAIAFATPAGSDLEIRWAAFGQPKRVVVRVREPQLTALLEHEAHPEGVSYSPINPRHCAGAAGGRAASRARVVPGPVD
jgi:hypothetical protein